jgi:hypothetical protein
LELQRIDLKIRSAGWSRRLINEIAIAESGGMGRVGLRSRVTFPDTARNYPGRSWTRSDEPTRMKGHHDPFEVITMPSVIKLFLDADDIDKQREDVKAVYVAKSWQMSRKRT